MLWTLAALGGVADALFVCGDSGGQQFVGIVVDDLAAATEFFVGLGLELQGEGPVEVAGWTASWR
jgi:hypothetical protein